MATNAPTGGKDPFDAAFDGAQNMLTQLDQTTKTLEGLAVTDLDAAQQAGVGTIRAGLNAARAAIDGTMKGAVAVTKAAKNKL